MPILSQGKAAKEQYAPARSSLFAKSKQDPIPGYFVSVGSKLKIDTNHPDWIALLEKRGAPPLTKSGKVKTKKTVEEKKAIKNRALARDLDIQERRLKNKALEYKNLNLELKLEKDTEKLLEKDLVMFLYAGYMEKIGLEFLNLGKKLEPIIDNLVKTGDTAGILKRLKKESKNIIEGIKNQQEKEIQEWEEGSE